MNTQILNSPEFQLCKRVVQSFRDPSTPSKSGKKSIDMMNLNELLEAKEKYLIFVRDFPDHPDREIKTHIYNTYLIPRIEELQLEEKVIGTLVSPPPKLEELQQGLLID